MRSLIVLSLFAMTALPTLAQAPAVPAPSSPATSTPSAGAAATGLDAVMSKLAGKPQIIGLTAPSGAHALAHVLSTSPGQYDVQTFHFAGPPKYGTKTTGTGRKKRTVRTTEQSTIPDDEAVRLLLQGVAGKNTKPRELPAAQVFVSANQIKFVQALSPPSKKAAADKTKPAPWTMITLWPTPPPAH